MKEDGMALDLQVVLENLAANAEARELVEESLAIAGFADGTIDRVLAWARQNGRAARALPVITVYTEGGVVNGVELVLEGNAVRHTMNVVDLDDDDAIEIPVPASMIEKANRHGD